MEGKYKSSVTSPRIPNFEWQDPQDDYDLATYRDIVEYGVSILHVVADPEVEYEQYPHDYFYTVGFYINLGHPEFIVMGIQDRRCAQMLNSIFAYVEDGHTIQADQTLRYDLGAGETIFVAKPVLKERYFDYLGWGCWFYRSLFWKVPPLAEHKYPVLQLYWPDPDGKYPWEMGCDPNVVAIQTLVEQPDPRK